jgi:hypothetical protein
MKVLTSTLSNFVTLLVKIPNTVAIVVHNIFQQLQNIFRQLIAYVGYFIIALGNLTFSNNTIGANYHYNTLIGNKLAYFSNKLAPLGKNQLSYTMVPLFRLFPRSCIFNRVTTVLVHCSLLGGVAFGEPEVQVLSWWWLYCCC